MPQIGLQRPGVDPVIRKFARSPAGYATDASAKERGCAGSTARPPILGDAQKAMIGFISA
jgi:hypothetical protein